MLSDVLAFFTNLLQLIYHITVSCLSYNYVTLNLC